MSTKPIITDWKPINEYTTPLKGDVVYRNVGIIKAVTKTNLKISVGKIAYERYDEENFQYIISPFWHIIDGLTPDVFHGIPGIDMDMRLKDYYRVNYEPVFITERSPSRNREDLWELMESVGLDYYDRFEWLIRTKLRAGNDNLIVERMREVSENIYYARQNVQMDFEIKKENIFVETDSRSNTALKRALSYMQYGDKLIIADMTQLGSNAEQLAANILKLIYAGVEVQTINGKWELNKDSFSTLIPILKMQVEMNTDKRNQSQQQGIEAAKNNNKYRGRQKHNVSIIDLEESYKKFKNGQITIEEAMNIAKVSSKSTYYRRVKEMLD